MIHFAFCGHGSYGSALKESLDMLLPEKIDVSIIDFPKSMDTTELTEQVQKVLEEYKDHPILFICDIIGGAPFKTCAIESLGKENTGVLGGANLAGILEICFMRDRPLQEVMKKAQEATRESVDYLPQQ